MGALDGKVVVVTGAGKGIGKAIAIGFAKEGASVCCSARNETDVAEVAATIGRAGGEALHQVCDVTDLQAVERLFKATQERFGGIDIVVANAGIQAEGASVELGDPAQWKAIIDTNLMGAYYTMRTAVPYLRQRGSGKIIAIGSGAGRRSMPNSSAYSCSKAGLWALVRALALEVAPFRVSVNELIPGPVDTDMLRSGISAANIEQVKNVEWFKQPEEVVPMALFIASQPEFGPTSQSYSLMRREG